MRRIIRKSAQPVHMRVHPDFFEQLEKQRRNMERKSKRNFTQIELTEALSKTQIKFPNVGRNVLSAIKKTKQKRRRN